MSVSDISPIAEFGNATAPIGATQTKFDFVFPIINTTDIEIRFDGEVVPNSGNTAFTVSMQDGSGGSVTFAKAPKVTDPTLTTLQIRRDTPFTRHTEYTDNGDLLAKTINDDFDRLWLCLQEERASADASLSRPAGAKYWEAQQMKISHVADGTADDDAATVKQVRQFTQTAQQSATASAASATASAGSAAASETSNKASKAAQTAAEAARDAAKGWSDKADTTAAAAANAATTAAQAQIAPYVAQAKAQADTATTQANLAVQAAADAAADAKQSANDQIAPQVALAVAAKTAAQLAATTAADDAKTAAQALIQPFVDTATAKATAAANSATNAGTQATNAGTSATAAQASATLAKGYADNAAASAQTAGQKATAAAASAQSASDLKDSTAAAAAAAATTAATTAAAGYTSQAGVSAADADGAKTDAQAARSGAQTAQTAAEAAQAAAEAALDNLKAAALQKASNLSDVANKATALQNLQDGKPLPLAADGSGPNDAVTVRQLGQATGSSGATMNGVMNNFLGAVEWFNGSRTKLPAGYVLSDGQVLNRADYPELWAAVQSGFFASVADDKWLNSGFATNPLINRGKYSTGDGTTTFRVPDLNGATVGSISSLFLRGNSGNVAAYGDIGSVVGYHLPNITGAISLGGSTGLVSDVNSTVAGAFVRGTAAKTAGLQYNTQLPSKDLLFDASKSSPAYGKIGPNGSDPMGDVAPSSATGLWIIRANGVFNADTSFNVTSNDDVAPAKGSGVNGGYILSDYNVGGKNMARALFRVVKTMGGPSVARFSMFDWEGKTQDAPANYIVDFPSSGGQLVTRESIGFGNTSGIIGPNNPSDARVNGLYVGQGANAAGFPSATSAYAPYLHLARGPGGTANQIAFEASGTMYVRGTGDGGATWNTWYRIPVQNGANNFVGLQRIMSDGAALTIQGTTDTGALAINANVASGASNRWQVGNIRAAQPNEVTLVNNKTGGALTFWTSTATTLTSGTNGAKVMTLNASGSVNLPAGGYLDATGFHASSDIRLKDNIVPAAPGALRRIASIELKEFNWRDGGGYTRGYIAQQVQKIDPLYVSVDDCETSAKKGMLAVSQSVIIADLIGAIQELKAEVEALKAGK